MKNTYLKVFKMFSKAQLLFPVSSLVVRKAGFKNYVKSETLSQLSLNYEKRCIPPEPRPAQKVAVIGAASEVGQMASLFLKQQNVIKELALYDDLPEKHVIGVANDLAHIDTSTIVEAYQGWTFLKDALHRADVVLICGGYSGCCDCDHDVFMANLKLVRRAATAIAQFCPRAVVALQTPPVDCNFALCAWTLNARDAYDGRRLLGVNSVNSMRANQLYSSMMGTDPTKSNVAVVGGCCRHTRVPVFSAAKPSPLDCNVPKERLHSLTRLVRDADDVICNLKTNMKIGQLSIGFATARFVINVMKGMFESPTLLDSALVEQKDPEKCYGMQVCATPVMVGRGGIQQYTIPELNEAEEELLAHSKYHLDDLLNLGRCYAEGDDYLPPSCYRSGRGS